MTGFKRTHFPPVVECKLGIIHISGTDPLFKNTVRYYYRIMEYSSEDLFEELESKFLQVLGAKKLLRPQCTGTAIFERRDEE